MNKFLTVFRLKMLKGSYISFAMGIFAIVISNIVFAQEESNTQEIFAVVAQTLVAREKPVFWGVWNNFIENEALTNVRVPGHNPENQFVRNIPQLDWALQLSLVAPSNEQKAKQQVVEFDIDPTAGKFIGFLNRSQLQNIARSGQRGSLLVGFSRIAFGDKGKSALLYSEICTANTEPVCGGDEFFLEQDKKSWVVKKHAQLWMGGIRPFWSFN